MGSFNFSLHPSDCFSNKTRTPLEIALKVGCIFLCAIAFFCNVLLSYAANKTETFHQNFRRMFLHWSGSTVLLQFFEVAFFLLPDLVLMFQDYSIIFHPLLCHVSLGVCDVFFVFNLISQLAIAVEQLFCIRRTSSKKKRLSHRTVSVLLILCWLWGLGNATSLILVPWLDGRYAESPGSCKCGFQVISEGGSWYIVVGYMVYEAVVMFIHLITLKKSRKDLAEFGINTARYSLAQRYQIRETIRTMEMLIPALLGQALLIMVGLCLGLMNPIPIENTESWLFIMMIPTTLSSIFFPLICFKRNKFLRQNLPSLFKNRHIGVSAVGPTRNTGQVSRVEIKGGGPKIPRRDDECDLNGPQWGKDVAGNELRVGKVHSHNLSPESSQKAVERVWSRFGKLPPIDFAQVTHAKRLAMTHPKKQIRVRSLKV